MQIRILLLADRAPLAITSVQAGHRGLEADAQSAAALTGQVTSAEEGTMEGVVVSAKKAGSTMTVSVISDAPGQFQLPGRPARAREYCLRIRAVGYDSMDQGRRRWSGRASGRDQAAQDQEPRRPAYQRRMGDEHSRHAGSRRTSRPVHQLPHARAAAEVELRHRRAGQRAHAHGSYAPGSTPLEPHKRLDGRRAWRARRPDAAACRLSRQHQSQPAGDMELSAQALPRLTGRSTHVIMTEYDLPRPTAMPHDVILDQPR